VVTYTTTIKRFAKQGEKTGWTYIDISTARANQINPGKKVGYRVRGFLDQHPIQRVSIMPMGNGAFIMPLNAKLRRLIGKEKDDKLTVKLELDSRNIPLSAPFMQCLRDEPRAMTHFKTLSGSHQRYFSKWIDDAKTIHTKTKRITMAVNALARGHGFPEMLRADRASRQIQ